MLEVAQEGGPVLAMAWSRRGAVITVGIVMLAMLGGLGFALTQMDTMGRILFNVPVQRALYSAGWPREEGSRR